MIMNSPFPCMQLLKVSCSKVPITYDAYICYLTVYVYFVKGVSTYVCLNLAASGYKDYILSID